MMWSIAAEWLSAPLSMSRFVDVSSALLADAQSPEAVQPGEGPLDHPAVGSQSCAVPRAAPCDGGHNAWILDLVAVDVVVVATVCKQ